MGNHTNNFNDSVLEQAEKRRVQDLDDLHSEMNGNDVGRIARFLSADARSQLKEKRTGQSPKGLSALDMMLLTNPEYAKAYEGAMNTLEGAESATERALDKLEVKLETAKSSLQSTLDNAAELADGTKVFLGKDSKFYSENGDVIDDDLASQIERHGTEPTYETYIDQRNSVQALENSIYEVRVYQTDLLGNARSELTDTNNPKSIEEVEAIAKEVLDQMPDSVLLELEQDEMAQKISNNTDFTLSKPNL